MPDINLLLNGLRFATALPGYLRKRISLEEAKAIVHSRLVNRETNFLQSVESSVFGYAGSPYRPLFEAAQCQFGDLRQTVTTQGLQNTLRLLREAGVFIKFEEFKGRKPIDRNGTSIPVRAHDFDNPFQKKTFVKTSSGSTGRATRTYLDLDYLAAQAPSILLAHEAHGVQTAPTLLWMVPVISIADMLRWARFGKAVDTWFSPSFEGLPKSHKYMLTVIALRAAGRLAGFPIPKAEHAAFKDVERVVAAIARLLKLHGKCLLVTFVSSALRVCLEALRLGIDLTGTTILSGGEPPTPAKVETITSSGARWFPGYWFSEAGAVAKSCANPVDENDLHLFEDMFGLIQHKRKVDGHDITVDAFLCTSLLPMAPKVMINVELDDYGVIESRPCGCPLHEAGYQTHLRNIRSYSKLCCEGMSLLQGEMLHILEEILPERFGGSPNDYQLWEEEDSSGFTNLVLVVDPSIPAVDISAVEKTIADTLKQETTNGAMAQSILQQAHSLKVRREKPKITASGKLLPLHLNRSGS